MKPWLEASTLEAGLTQPKSDDEVNIPTDSSEKNPQVPAGGDLRHQKKAVAPAAGPTAPASTAECLERARQLVAQGDLTRVATLLNRANRDPASPAEMRDAWAQLGLAYFGTGDYPKMEIAYLWAVHYDPNDFVSAFNLGRAQQSQEKFELAEASYLMADRIQPNNEKVWCNLGTLYFHLERYPEAAAGFKKAIKANLFYARAWDNLAAVLSAQNKWDDALIAVRMALKIRPDYPEAYFKLGAILFQKNSLREANEAFQHCLGNSSLAEAAQPYLTSMEGHL